MDKVTGLMTGADDYVTKPFSPAELTARVDALLRRAGDAPLVSAAVGEISQPPFLLNMTDRVVEKNGKRLRLTQLEYQIMKLFMENPDKALTREEILDTVWGRGYFGELTFPPGAALDAARLPEPDRLFGSLLTLPTEQT